MAILGIIGGIAPGSTVDYYELLIERYRAACPDGGYPQLVINSINLEQLLQLVAADEHDTLIEFLTIEIQRLAQAGADMALFASNTPHLVFDAVAARAPIPLISIVEVTARATAAQQLTHVGLVGTRFTMEGGFYQDVFHRLGIQVTTPGDSERAWIHERYLGELVNGEFRTETRGKFREIILRMRDDVGIDGIVLGGTEIPLLLRGEDLGELTTLDTTSLHVDEAIARLQQCDG
ncbi:MAG: amino acid racemase [Pirellulales bacterium]|nr:amino acid racemase [Pirellulales bacterium]